MSDLYARLTNLFPIHYVAQAMMRHTIIAAALIAFVWAAAIPEEKKEEKDVKIPDQYKKLAANVVKNLAKFTPEEKEKLKDFAKKVLVWMMAKAKAKLSVKGELMKKILEKKVNALGAEAKKYITEKLEESYKFHKAIMAGEKPKPEELKKWAENTISSYKALSEDAKKDIAKQFPVAVALAKNEKIREIVKAHLAMKFGPKKEDAKDEKEVATPEQYKKLIATHVLKHLAKLTPEEKEKLKVVAKKVLTWLLAKAKAKLAAKAETVVERKVKALDDEARRFVVQRLEQAYKVHKMIMAGEKLKPEQLKMWAENTISNYKELSKEAKEDIAKQFPIAHGLVKNEKVRGIVKALLAKKIAETKEVKVEDTKEVKVEKAEEKEVTVPEQYKKLIAVYAMKHLAKMTPEEREKLKDVAKKALVWMMAKAKAKLGGKGEIIKKVLEKKITALGTEAKKFVTQRLEEAYKFHKAIMAGEKPDKEEMKKWANNTISSYKALSEDAKKEIAKQFPIGTALAKNEKLRGIVKALLAKKIAEKKAAAEAKKA
ncbi:hypothetical protein Y032_0005g2647 [Ancylostoma ceylanicum]|uniref:Fatty-acid and retinol-binding protein 1 n=1 Tax=Ancylostoma ceylanicum TaxID=53326 RepID=A0A016VS74_9BILA|nr:hypothetical protein Y032_0005g2647 [Ancylostoma ceylanicum]